MKKIFYLALFLLGAWTAYWYVERAGQQVVIPQDKPSIEQPKVWPASPGKDKG